MTPLRSVLTCLLLLVLLAPAARADDFDPEGRIATAAERLRAGAFDSRVGYETLAELCDEYGHRLSGSERLEAAIDWAAETMREFGLVNVHKEPVSVPVWVRNEESAAIVSPTHHRLAMLGLGRSVGTGPEGIEAAVVRAASFDEFAALPDSAVAGRIVLFDAPYEGYGKTVVYRGSGASTAAKRGAVAVLVRSVGLDGLRTPHTGALRYAEDAPMIPAAAVSFEDANLIARMLARGDEVRVHLTMGAETLEDRTSYNVVGELPGRELPEEIVLVGGHIDSWDVGQGAQDDGTGCVLSMEAVRLMHELGLVPRRTLRVVLFTNEENGLRGGRAYAEAHADEVGRHVVAMESDTGNGLASGFRFDLREAALGPVAALTPATTEASTNGEEGHDPLLEEARDRGLSILERVAPLLAPLGSGQMVLSYSGADIGPMVEAGVPGLGVDHDTSEYFRIHHTEADTFDRIDLRDLQTNAATMAIMLYALAETDLSLRP